MDADFEQEEFAFARTLRRDGTEETETVTGPLGTGIWPRLATPGSCMKRATIGGGWN